MTRKKNVCALRWMTPISLIRAWSALDKYKLDGISVRHLNVNGAKSPQALMGELHVIEKMPVVLRVHSLPTKLGVTKRSQWVYLKPSFAGNFISDFGNNGTEAFDG